jgi:hypothetical protein
VPASGDGPALGLIRNTLASVIGRWIAIRMLENTGPTTKSTLSRSISCFALPTATSGFSSSS